MGCSAWCLLGLAVLPTETWTARLALVLFSLFTAFFPVTVGGTVVTALTNAEAIDPVGEPAIRPLWTSIGFVVWAGPSAIATLGVARWPAEKVVQGKQMWRALRLVILGRALLRTAHSAVELPVANEGGIHVVADVVCTHYLQVLGHVMCHPPMRALLVDALGRRGERMRSASGAAAIFGSSGTAALITGALRGESEPFAWTSCARKVSAPRTKTPGPWSPSPSRRPSAGAMPSIFPRAGQATRGSRGAFSRAGPSSSTNGGAGRRVSSSAGGASVHSTPLLP